MSKTALMLLATCSLAAAAAESELTGAWGTNLDGYEILVTQQRACGSWHYVATGSSYEGYFIGRVDKDQLHIERICGRPGSIASKWCEGQYPDATPEETGWTPPRDWTLAQVCHGQLVFYDKDPATGQRCRPDPSIGYARAAPREQARRMRALLDAAAREASLIECRALQAKRGQ